MGLKSFSSKMVILPCAGYYRMFTELYPRLRSLELTFEVRHCAEFLNERLKSIDFERSLERQIVLQDSCMSRRTRVNKSVRKLMGSIPGARVVDGKNICCGGTPMITFPQISRGMSPPFVETLVKETLDTGSDFLTNLCQLCEMTFYPCMGQHSFALKAVPTLISESMGGKEYENKWKQFWKCKSIDELIEITRENFEENGFTEEEVREVLPYMFRFDSKD